MTDDQMMSLSKYIEIEIGDERQFFLVVIGKNSGGGCEFKAASNANKQNAQNIFKIINEDLKPKVEAM